MKIWHSSNLHIQEYSVFISASAYTAVWIEIRDIIKGYDCGNLFLAKDSYRIEGSCQNVINFNLNENKIKLA